MSNISVTDRIERCLGEVRFVELPSLYTRKTKLQQAWQVQKWVGGAPISSEVEWRDVPTVELNGDDGNGAE